MTALDQDKDSNIEIDNKTSSADKDTPTVDGAALTSVRDIQQKYSETPNVQNIPKTNHRLENLSVHKEQAPVKGYENCIEDKSENSASFQNKIRDLVDLENINNCAKLQDPEVTSGKNQYTQTQAEPVRTFVNVSTSPYPSNCLKSIDTCSTGIQCDMTQENHAIPRLSDMAAGSLQAVSHFVSKLKAVAIKCGDSKKCKDRKIEDPTVGEENLLSGAQ